MEYMTIQKNITSSPRKLRLVADMVRKMTPEQALDVLSFTNKNAATPLSKAIKTVLANAKGAPILRFKTIEINEASKLKRYRAGTAGRGRGRPYKKRWSHIKIVLSDEILTDIKKPNLKTQKMSARQIKTPAVKVSEMEARDMNQEVSKKEAEVIEVQPEEKKGESK